MVGSDIATQKFYIVFSKCKTNSLIYYLRKILSNILRNIKMPLQLTKISDAKVHPDLNCRNIFTGYLEIHRKCH